MEASGRVLPRHPRPLLCYRVACALGATCLRAFGAAAQGLLLSAARRALDEHLTQIAV